MEKTKTGGHCWSPVENMVIRLSLASVQRACSSARLLAMFTSS